MIIQKKRKLNILPLILILVSFLLPFFNFSINTAYAEETVYSNVLEDLQKDENFNIEDYPVIEKDYSLQLIQIAESEDQELFVYVYQPSGQKLDLRATYLNLSLNNDALLSSLYTLKYLNSENTLFKYKVENVNIKSDTLRFYNITSIYRDFLEGKDEELDFDNKINAVSYKVAKIFEAYTSSHGVVYSCYDTEIIPIVDKYLGYVFSGTSSSSERRGDEEEGYKNYFVSFSTDKNIDKLLEATVSFASCYKYKRGHVVGSTGSTITWDDKSESPKSNEKTLYADEVVDVNTGRWFWKETYTFDRISTVNQFITDETRENTFVWGLLQADTYSRLTDEVEKKLKQMDYVLRFFESEYHYISQPRASFGATYYLYDCIDVSNVSIINLKFETNGKVFNLGVVDNMQSGSDKPSNDYGEDVGWADWVKWLVSVLVMILILFLLIPFFPIIFPIVVWVFKFIIKIVWYILKGIWWVITLPIEIFKE